MHQRSGLRNVRLYGASSVHGEQKWRILRIPYARNLAWLDSIGQIGFPNNLPQDRFETKAIAERNDGPISSYHISPDLVVARPLFKREREIWISDKHDRHSVPLKFAVARLAGNEMHPLRLDPSVEPRVEQAVCRGQHLTRTNQCAGAVAAMTKPMNDIHAANRDPRPSVRSYGFPMINRPKNATRIGCWSRLLSFSANEKERDTCYCGNAQHATSGFIPEHS